MLILKTDLHRRDPEEEDEVRRIVEYGDDTAEVEFPHPLVQDHVTAATLVLEAEPYGDLCRTTESRYQPQWKKG